MFPQKFCKIHRETSSRACNFTKNGLRVAASENNEQQQLYEGFANSCCKIVSPILLQELINDFVVCEHGGGTLLFSENVTSSHGFGNYNYLFQTGATLFNRSTQNIPYFYVTLHKVYFLTNLVTSLVFAKLKQILSKQQVLF